MKRNSKPTPEGKRAEGALKKAVADVIAEHKRLGVPIAVMRNGKAVYVQLENKAPSARESNSKYRTKGNSREKKNWKIYAPGPKLNKELDEARKKVKSGKVRNKKLDL